MDSENQQVANSGTATETPVAETEAVSETPAAVADWRGGLPKELRSEVSQYESVEELVREHQKLSKSHQNLHAILGKKSEAFTPEDWKAFASVHEGAHVVPANPSEYTIKTEFDDGRVDFLDEKALSQLKVRAHEMKLNPGQAQGVYNLLSDVLNNINSRQAQNFDNYVAENLDELKKDWGEAADSKLQLANFCMNKILPEITGKSASVLQKKLEESGLLYDATAMKLFARLGELCSNSASQAYSNISPMDAKARMEHIRNDPTLKQVLGNRHHPQHESVLNEFRYYAKLANGE
jgi:hypothetical protein